MIIRSRPCLSSHPPTSHMGPSKLSPIDAGLSPQGRYMAPDRNFEENSVSALSYSLGPAHLDEIARRNKLASE